MSKNREKHPWAEAPQETLERLQSGEKGLTHEEAASRLKKYGLNDVEKGKKKTALQILLKQFLNPLIFVLVVACVISLLLRETADVIIIFSIVVINGLLGFWQEFKAEKIIRSLENLISKKARVLRKGEKIEIDTKFLVPGDIVLLGIGDMVPADLRLLSQEEMTIDESSLTGESVPVLKTTAITSASRNLPQYLKNMAFMGTHVMSGYGQGVIIATGKETFFGRSAAYLNEPENPSDFEQEVAHLSAFLLKLVAIMTVFIFAANTLLSHGVLQSFLFALALAVGITPEALPIIITITLSNGARALAKSKVIVKRLSAIEDLGNMDVLCTDKTGTLTQGKLALHGFFAADGKENSELLLYGMLCNDSSNAIDKSIVESPLTKKSQAAFKNYHQLDKNEFDFNRRRMSVVAKAPNGDRTLIVKGAMESMEKICTHIVWNGKVVKLDAKMLAKYTKTVHGLQGKGLSTITVATKTWRKDSSSEQDEKGLTLMGFLTFMDPPRRDVKASLLAMENLGIVIKLLSGDDPLVTEAICNRVGLVIEGGKVYTGDELESLSEKDFVEVVNRYNVFARVSPDQKYKIVQALNTGDDHTVAFMGDGINDAPAIKVADVGISVDTATDIAKEAADIILTQKSLKVVVEGIKQGRRIFGNIHKYILNTVSANYGNMFTVATSSLFLKFIPLLPSQILLNNLVTDTPMMAVASDRVDEEELVRPEKLDVKEIQKHMTRFGLLSTFFDLSLILTLLLVFHASTDVFRSTWFLESALSEVVVTFAVRTKKPFYKSRPGALLSFMSLLIVIVLILLMTTPLGAAFGLVTLNLTLIGLVLGIVALYFCAAEGLKWYLYRRTTPQTLPLSARE